MSKDNKGISVSPDHSRNQRVAEVVRSRKARRDSRVISARETVIAAPLGRGLGKQTENKNEDVEKQLSHLSMNEAKVSNSSRQEYFRRQQQLPPKLERLSEYAEGVMHPKNEDDQMDCLIGLRKLLSLEYQPPVQEVISSQVVPSVIHLLNHSQNPLLRFEAAWVITNIASGTDEQTALMVRLGAVENFVSMVRDGDMNESYVEQAVWGLGNIAGTSAETRDYVLKSGALLPLTQLCDTLITNKINQSMMKKKNNKNRGHEEEEEEEEEDVHPGGCKTNNTTLFRNVVWALSNLVRYKPFPASFFFTTTTSFFTSSFLPLLSRLLSSFVSKCLTDDEVIVDACWLLSYMTDISKEESDLEQRVDHIFTSGIPLQLVSILKESSPASNHLKVPIVSIFLHLTRTINITQKQFLISNDFLRVLLSFIASPKKGLRADAFAIVANLAQGHAMQIQAIINNNFIPKLMQETNLSQPQIAPAVIDTFFYMCTYGTANHIQFLVQSGILPFLCLPLQMESKAVMNVNEKVRNLYTLDLILKSVSHDKATQSKYLIEIEECGGLDSLEMLQRSEDYTIAEVVGQLLSYYAAEEEEYDLDETTEIGHK